jgi:ABC-type sugar transport system ATPase subunit
MNVVPTTIDHDNRTAALGGGTFRLHDTSQGKAAALLGFRPEDISLTDPNRAPRAQVTAVELLGAETILSATLEGGSPIAMRAPRDLVARPGDVIGLSVGPDALHLFDPESGIAFGR